MVGCARMLRGVLVRRRVAAADLAARHAHAQVHPAVADREAILTTCDVLRQVDDLDLIGVRADRAHALKPRGSRWGGACVRSRTNPRRSKKIVKRSFLFTTRSSGPASN